MKQIFLKRVYDPFDEGDGCRVLVDRLWPRGISKENARLDFWLKDVAPSTKLRKEFNHMHEKYEEFRTQYLQELREEPLNSQAVEQIIQLAADRNVTLLYGAKDPVYNHAHVLLEEINRRAK